MTPNQLHILQHSLGCNEYGIASNRFPRDEPYYRNYYVSSPTPDLTALVLAGYMTVRPGSDLTGGDNVYHVTDKGIAAMKAESPAPPKLTRSQRRYRAFLRADLDCTFAEYLKNAWYKPLATPECQYDRETFIQGATMKDPSPLGL